MPPIIPALAPCTQLRPRHQPVDCRIDGLVAREVQGTLGPGGGDKGGQLEARLRLRLRCSCACVPER